MVQYSFESVATSVIPVLRMLMNTSVPFHILVYSGDVDAIVPTAGTLNWIKLLGSNVKEPWRVWVDERGQAGGFVTVYNDFVFSTIRGAGHMAPQYQPARTFQLIDRWIHLQRPPD